MAVSPSPLVGTSFAATLPQSRSYSGLSGSASPLSSPANTEQNKTTDAQETATDKKVGELLSLAEQQSVSQLKTVDKRVKAHEMAHLLAAGGYAKGGASYQYRQGPDGKKYAVAGEVQIDSGKENTPARTIAKMKMVQRAALAPADPSSQDRRVAAQASRNILDASQEIRLEAVAVEKDASELDAADKDKNNGLSSSGEASTKERGNEVVVSSLAGQKGSTAYASSVGHPQNSSLFNLFA